MILAFAMKQSYMALFSIVGLNERFIDFDPYRSNEDNGRGGKNTFLKGFIVNGLLKQSSLKLFNHEQIVAFCFKVETTIRS